MLGDVAVGFDHITCHDARDGFLAEIVIEEGIDLLGGLGGVGIDRCMGDIELHSARTAAGDTDVVDEIPGPVGGDLNGVVARTHDEGTYLYLTHARDRCLERTGAAIDGDINRLFSPLAVVADIDGIFSILSSRVGKGDLGIVFLHSQCLSTRILVVFNQFTVLVGGILGLQLRVSLR